MRKENILKTALVGFFEELVAIVSAFILPRMILLYFGSVYNGIISSVTQFIGCIALLKSGIGMATKAALYKPLYDKDIKKINGIMSATMIFLRRVALIFVISIIIFASIYPLIIDEEFSRFFTFSLVLIIGLGTFFQYYFGLANQLLIEADQKYYIISFITIINIFFNTVVSVLCMKLGMGIHKVKLFSSIVYCSTPIFLNWYVSKHYGISRKAEPDWKSISKRWDAFGMQIANFVNDNTDIIIASIFLNMKEVSVYTIYHLVINGIKKLINRISIGFESALGNLSAENNYDNLRDNFLNFEFALNILCTVLFSCLIILIVPFIKIYTSGVNDTNYIRYRFAIISCASQLFFCIRLSYTYIVQATGKFVETKKYFYIEAVTNIVLSILLVNVIGISGIVTGTLISMIYRTIVFGYFVYKNIIHYSIKKFRKRIMLTLLCITANSCIGIYIIRLVSIDNYFQWIKISIIIFILSLLSSLFIYYVIDKRRTSNFINQLINSIKHIKKNI